MAHRGPVGVRALSAAILFAPSPSTAVDYIRNTSLGENSCAGATASDSCYIFCDDEADSKGNMNTFDILDCGAAGSCYVECQTVAPPSTDGKTNAELDAQNSNYLRVRSYADKCMKSVTVNTPSNGNASFESNFPGSLEEMSIQSGANTQSIIVDCTYPWDDCLKMQINAATARYLEINVGSNAPFGDYDDKTDSGFDTTIYCPQHTDYTGPGNAPCIINLADGGSVVAYVYALYGVPKNFWIEPGIGTADDVMVNCNGGTEALYSVLPSNLCWQTNSPTSQPSHHPTPNPSPFPTRLPTPSPSPFPTAWPSRSPTRSPTGFPTTLPSTSPSQQHSSSPSKIPSRNPSHAPSAGSVIHATDSPTTPPTQTTTQQDEDTDSDSDNQSDSNQPANSQSGSSLSSLSRTAKISLICVGVIIIASLLVLFVLWMYREHEKAENEGNLEKDVTGARSKAYYVKSPSMSATKSVPEMSPNSLSPVKSKGVVHIVHKSQDAKFADHPEGVVHVESTNHIDLEEDDGEEEVYLGAHNPRVMKPRNKSRSTVHISVISPVHSAANSFFKSQPMSMPPAPVQSDKAALEMQSSVFSKVNSNHHVEQKDTLYAQQIVQHDTNHLLRAGDDPEVVNDEESVYNETGQNGTNGAEEEQLEAPYRPSVVKSEGIPKQKESIDAEYKFEGSNVNRENGGFLLGDDNAQDTAQDVLHHLEEDDQEMAESEEDDTTK